MLGLLDLALARAVERGGSVAFVGWPLYAAARAERSDAETQPRANARDFVA
jgi:hypothetical protein